MPEAARHDDVVASEFERAARSFARRTAGRFEHLDVVRFARLRAGEDVVEVGAGTGNFLSLFAEARRRVAVDLTHGMLREARARHAGLDVVGGDALRLPLRDRSFDLVASAQALHHMPRPVPALAEMRRIVADGGRVLVVDQVSTESYEQTVVMTELEKVRDPSHAASRPPSAFRIMLRAAGLRVVDERVVEETQRLSNWMWPGEFPQERIDAVRAFIERFGDETGMGFRRDGDDWAFTRRRIMLLAIPG